MRNNKTKYSGGVSCSACNAFISYRRLIQVQCIGVSYSLVPQGSTDIKMNKKSCLVPIISNSNCLKYYVISVEKQKQKQKNIKQKIKTQKTINVNNILDILGISVFGYSIYMYEKQDLFSNDIDKF